ncbi:MAG TPA: phosphoribosylformylglycinamidine synthase subunit PurS [Candidatus Altiarchaeales archaeon]|nr:phosphoribosylformylglycinamidine synthase subunit PurS [Candidatus Altiarchaeales archaeon]
MNYRAEVRIELKKGVIDAEGETVQKSLNLLGFPVKRVKSVKIYVIEIDAKSRGSAEKTIENACKKLLANPVIQNYTIEIK